MSEAYNLLGGDVMANEKPERPVYNLKNLDGINEARNDIFNRAMIGEISESRAKLADRFMRSAKEQNGDLVIRAVQMTRGDNRFQSFTEANLVRLTTFVNGPSLKAPEEG